MTPPNSARSLANTKGREDTLQNILDVDRSNELGEMVCRLPQVDAGHRAGQFVVSPRLAKGNELRPRSTDCLPVALTCK